MEGLMADLMAYILKSSHWLLCGEQTIEQKNEIRDEWKSLAIIVQEIDITDMD